MCGIVGTIGRSETFPSLDKIKHRGPDGQGHWNGALWGEPVSLGMARLAIVDGRDLRVPFRFMGDDRGWHRIVLAFNGEIYNWRELRAELSDGTPWETECDAEVVARAWCRWGAKCLTHFNGMFAFALIDMDRQQAFLARDRAGEKPLYYQREGDALHFASEIKALPGERHEKRCDDLETLEFDCGVHTPFEGIYSLGPGEYMRFTGLGEDETGTWWSLPESAPDGSLTFESAAEDLEALVIDAVRLRARTDVPMALALSGGLDSAIIQAIARCEQLDTVSFPGTSMDTWADAVTARKALSPDALHEGTEFCMEDLKEALPEIAWHLDTPATWTAVCQWFMAHRMAERGRKVVLTGEGADELFAGYMRYRVLWHLDRMRADLALANYGPTIQSALDGNRFQILARMLDRSPGGAMRAHAAGLVMRHASRGSSVAGMARVDFHTTMQVLLRMADRMFAAVGMENRAPFLDHRIMELSARLPERFKIDERGSKLILREVARRLGVPREITDNPTKRGLAVPWAAWCRDSVTAGRGAWDRHVFARMMRVAWRRAFFGGAESRQVAG